VRVKEKKGRGGIEGGGVVGEGECGKGIGKSEKKNKGVMDE
jgi:hypothetical protein